MFEGIKGKFVKEECDTDKQDIEAETPKQHGEDIVGSDWFVSQVDIFRNRPVLYRRFGRCLSLKCSCFASVGVAAILETTICLVSIELPTSDLC